MMERETKWTCDVCENVAHIKSTNIEQGMEKPSGWGVRTIHLSADQKNYEWQREVLMCNSCKDDFCKLYSFKPEDRKVLKKNFWQKILGRFS